MRIRMRDKNKNVILAAGSGGALAVSVTWAILSEGCLTGKRATSRDAISPVADCAHSPRGSREIINANRFVAASLGRSFNRAASPHGSTPDRARTESMVSTIPFSSSPTGA